MLSLSSDGWDVSLPCNLFLLRRGTRRDSSVAAVVADPVHGCVIDYGGVVNVVNVGDVDVVDGTVVEKASAFPASAFVAFTEVAESVNDPAIETNPRPPIAFMENKCFAAPAP